MKSKKGIIAIVVFVVIVICVSIFINHKNYPFHIINSKEILLVKVIEDRPPYREMTLSDEETKEFISYLNSLKVVDTIDLKKDAVPEGDGISVYMGGINKVFYINLLGEYISLNDTYYIAKEKTAYEYIDKLLGSQ